VGRSKLLGVLDQVRFFFALTRSITRLSLLISRPCVYRCTLRGLTASALSFLGLLEEHPSQTLRALVTDHLMPLIKDHPRSTSFALENKFILAHGRWRERVNILRGEFAGAIEQARDDPNEDLESWEPWVDELIGVLEGNAEIILQVCSEGEGGGWGYAEAVGAWGVWVDVGLRRSHLE